MAREKRAEAAKKRIQHGSTQRPRHALVPLPPGPNTVRRVRKPLPTPTGGSASYGALCGRVFIPLHPPLCPLSTSASSGYWPPHVAHFGLQGRASSPALPAAAIDDFIHRRYNSCRPFIEFPLHLYSLDPEGNIDFNGASWVFVGIP